MISEPFASGNSIIHKLDPRIRVIVATVYCFVVAFSNQFPVLLIAVLISSALIISAGLGIKAVGKRLVIVNGLILLLWVVVPLTYGGQPLFQLGPFSLSRAGIMLAARITLKSNAILLSMIALIATMKFATLGYALNQLCVPQKLIQLLLMNYRYIFVLEQEYQRLIRAAKIRGFQPKTNLHTYRTQSPTRAPGDALPWIQGHFLQLTRIQSRLGRFDIFRADDSHHGCSGFDGMVVKQVSGVGCQVSGTNRFQVSGII